MTFLSRFTFIPQSGIGTTPSRNYFLLCLLRYHFAQLPASLMPHILGGSYCHREASATMPGDLYIRSTEVKLTEVRLTEVSPLSCNRRRNVKYKVKKLSESHSYFLFRMGWTTHHFKQSSTQSRCPSLLCHILFHIGCRSSWTTVAEWSCLIGGWLSLILDFWISAFVRVAESKFACASLPYETSSVPPRRAAPACRNNSMSGVRLQLKEKVPRQTFLLVSVHI